MSIARCRGRAICSRAFVVSSLLIAAAGASPTAPSQRALTVDDVIDLVQVSAPRIPPDGRRTSIQREQRSVI